MKPTSGRAKKAFIIAAILGGIAILIFAMLAFFVANASCCGAPEEPTLIPNSVMWLVLLSSPFLMPLIVLAGLGSLISLLVGVVSYKGKATSSPQRIGKILVSTVVIGIILVVLTMFIAAYTYSP